MKIISLNIEQDKHYKKHKDFFTKEKPDVVCLQEIFEEEVEKYKELFKMDYSYFAPMVKFYKENDRLDNVGIAIFSREQPSVSKIHHIFETQEDKPIVQYPSETRDMSLLHWRLVEIVVTIQDKPYNIFTTHAPVTVRGDIITDFQREYFKKLNNLIQEKNEFMLCGDFNAPRGYELFDNLATKYTDNIPVKYTTSIDNNIHRSGHKDLQYVVDGFFTNGNVKVTDIKYQNGVSDHFAIVANIK